MLPKTANLYRPMEEVEPRCLVELKMMKMSQEIRSKPKWFEKITQPRVVTRWRTEAEAQGLSEEAINFVLDELNYFITLREGSIEPGPVDGTWKADELIEEEISSKLQKLVTESLETGEKDYHPGSDDLVVDLVHPSLYCFVEDHSVLINETSIDAKMLPKTSDEKPEKKPKLYDFDKDPPSGKYRWLPAEVSCSDDLKVSFDSYINNLHPIKNKELYNTIGSILGKFIPLFSKSLNDVKNLGGTKLNMGDWAWYGDDDFDHDKYRDDEDSELYDREFNEYQENRPILPVPIPKFQAPKAAKSVIDLKGEKLQVIVKLANIELTPEKPKYDGGSWHVEGIAEERIVATGIYYYKVENITSSKLLFRQSIRDPSYEQNDMRGVLEVYGLENEGPMNQVIGELRAEEGRCIVFPNIYQHFVAPFELADKTKPGVRKILVFFLVDPTVKIISTHNVLPQQEDWEDVEKDAPAEKRKTMTRKQAEEFREKLMFERKYARDEFQKEFYEREFSLCEH